LSFDLATEGTMKAADLDRMNRSCHSLRIVQFSGTERSLQRFRNSNIDPNRSHLFSCPLRVLEKTALMLGRIGENTIGKMY
jgi:hypothetical protein